MPSNQFARLTSLIFSLLLSASVLANELEYTTIDGAGGVPLNMVTRGDSGRPAIVLIHGLGQSHHSWQAQLTSTLTENYYLVSYDLRGHGNSGKPWEASAYSDSSVWAEDLNRVIVASGAKQPILVGWSYGTLVISDYLRHFPDKSVAGLVLVGAYGGLTDRPTANANSARRREEAIKMQELFQSKNLDENYAAAKIQAHRLTALEMSDEWYAMTTAINMLPMGEARRWMFDRDLDNRDLVADLEAPLLVFVGGQDQNTPEDLAKNLAASVKDARIVMFEESGHSPFAEFPERFNRELSEFAEKAATQQPPDFWLGSAGWWASDNTYLDGKLQQSLAAYHSLMHIEVYDTRVVETTYKFYPPGNAGRFHSEGQVGEDRGIELITVVELEIVDDAGMAATLSVTPRSAAQPCAMTTTPLSSTLALQRKVEPESERDYYHTVITMPTPDRRYTAMFGIYTGLENPQVEAGDLRGLALFAGRRIDASEVEALHARFRDANTVGAVVSGNSDGDSLIEVLD